MVKDSGNAMKYEPYLGLEERDACGVGFVVNRGGERTHDIVNKVFVFLMYYVFIPPACPTGFLLESFLLLLFLRFVAVQDGAP